MLKKPLLYIIAFILLVISILYLNRAYRTLTAYTELSNRHNSVHNNYEELARQLNNAAILNPVLLKASNVQNAVAIFYTDSLIIIRQLNLLKGAVSDSMNTRIVATLIPLIRSEMAWLINSNVPDSIVHNTSPAHIVVLKKINSLIVQGLKRSTFLIEYQKMQLNDEIKRIRFLILLFVLLSALLISYTTIQFFSQRSKTEKKEKELEIVLNRISDAVVSVDNQWRYTFLNDAAMATHPFSKQETLGKVIWEVHPEMKGTIFWDKYHESMLTKKVVEIDSYYPAMNIWFYVKVYPSTDGVTIFYRDVTENKKAEQDIRQLNVELDQKVLDRTAELFESRNQLQQTLERVSFLASIADNIQDPVIATDKDIFITRWNKGAEQLLEWKSEEVIGENSTIILKGIYPNIDRTQILELLKEKHFWQGEVIYHTKAGRPVNVLVTVSDLKDAKDCMVGYLVLMRDITDRIKAEEKIKEFEHFFNNSNDLSCIANTEGYFEIVNPSFKKLMGYFQNELSTQPFLDFVHPDDIAATLHEYGKLKAGAQVIEFFNRYRKNDGIYLWLEWNASPNPVTGKLYCIARDITDRKKAEDALSKLNEELEQRVKERTAEIEKNEKRFRALIENNNDIISLMDEKFRVFYRSPSATRITGWTNDDILHIEGTKNIHPDDREAAVLLIKELMINPGKAINTLFRNQHKDGHYLWVEGTVINLLQDQDVKAILFNFRDVTARIETAERIIKSEKIYKTIASSIPGSVICLLSTDFRYLLIEGDMLEKLGYSKDKLLGNMAADVLPPENFAIVQKELKRALEGETVAMETTRLGFDTIARFIPLKDENNVVYAIMTVTIDITELKNAQRSITELNKDLEKKISHRTEQLKKSNEELEAFSYSVSHDLRAPLRGVLGFASILEDDYGSKLDDEARRLIGIIKYNSTKMAQLIDDLLVFSRTEKQELIKAKIDTGAMVTELVNELTTQNKEDQNIKWEIHPLPSMNADKNTIRQVWINLLSNAVKYSRLREQRVIEIGCDKEKKQTVFYVKDNGAGFDAAYAHKLFKVFQRLHDSKNFEGTGIGLAIVEKIVSRHGGKVWAENNLKEGACFYFSLPL